VCEGVVAVRFWPTGRLLLPILVATPSGKKEKKTKHQGKRHKMRENSGNNRSDPIATAQLRSQKENTLKPVSFFVFFEKKREKRVIERKKARIEVGPK